MNTIKITYDTNEQIEVAKGTTYIEISKYSKYKDTVVGVKKGNEILALTDNATMDETIEFFDYNSIEGAKIYKAALKFIFEVALKTLYPSAEIPFLHSVPRGMLGEVKYNQVLTIEDISKIKREMANIIDSNLPFIRYNILTKEAIDFYNSSNAEEKSANIKIYENIVTVYKLKNFLNYYYVSMPYSTRYIKQFDLKYLDNNRIIFLYPSNLTEGKIPEYVHHENIIKSFYEGKEWLKRLNTPYVYRSNKKSL